MVIGPSQVIILLLVGVLLFGNRLPDIGKQLARAIRDFKAGLGGIEDEVGHVNMAPAAPLAAARPPQRISQSLPKFERHADNGSV